MAYATGWQKWTKHWFAVLKSTFLCDFRISREILHKNKYTPPRLDENIPFNILPHPYLSHANTQFFGLGSACFALGSAFFAHSDPGSCVMPYFDHRIPYFDLRMAFAWIWAHDWGRGVKQPKNFFQNFQISWFVRIFNKKNHNFSFTFEIRLSFCTGVKWRVSFCTGVKWRVSFCTGVKWRMTIRI